MVFIFFSDCDANKLLNSPNEKLGELIPWHHFYIIFLSLICYEGHTYARTKRVAQ